MAADAVTACIPEPGRQAGKKRKNVMAITDFRREQAA